MALLGISLELVDCSSDTWNTGWMRDNARDRPSQNACDETFSTIGKGPRKRWSSFFEGRVVRMFRASSQTVSPTLNGGIGRRRAAEWTSYCLRAHDIWSRRLQMELLEICSDLVSSFRHNRFEGHFEFGVEALVRKEGGDYGAECDVLLYANSAKGRRLAQSSCW